MAETKSLAEALAAFQLDLPKLGKSSTADAGTYKYAYADLAEVSNVVLPLLAKHGLSFTTRPTLEDGRFVLAYQLLHTSGEHTDGCFPLPDKGSSQQMGSAITYARRYALSAVTGVAPDKDDDGAAAGEMRFDQAEEDPNRALQMEHFGVLLGRIDGAIDETALLEHGADVKRALSADKITPMQYDRLARRASERLAEFRTVSGDSTSDSHRGRVEPGPAGEGPGPDGERVAVSGPGGDEEPGPVRPGVQPSVHRRAGVGGSAQAPRDRGDAPSAVGGGR